VKGIILAGGSGTRLYPATLGISKQLLPVYDKPMIYYPLGVLMLADIRDILIISTPRDLPLFQQLLGDGSAYGISLSYKEQPQPGGLAEAFIIGKDFIGQDSVCLILGDNLFFGHHFRDYLLQARNQPQGATIFAYHVDDPHRYGVVGFNMMTGKPYSLVEKPHQPESNWAVTGLYFYDNKVVEMAATLTPSPRGELEITDINRLYLESDNLQLIRLGRGFAWLDTGTHESLFDAASYVRSIEKRQGIKIMCPEEIAFELGLLTADEVLERANNLGKTDYAAYLKRRVSELSHGQNPSHQA